MPDKYLNQPELKLPVKHSRLPLQIKKVEGFCKVCGRPTRDFRGTIREYAQCLDVEFGGICPSCNIVTHAHKYRLYEWGTLQQTPEGWIAHENQGNNDLRWEQFQDYWGRQWALAKKIFRGRK